MGNGGLDLPPGAMAQASPRESLSLLTAPDAQTGAIASSWHDFDGIDGSGPLTGTLGSYASVDFDLDGIGDYVFTSSLPGQLVVAFGAPGGGFRGFFDENNVFRFDRVYLDGFANAEGLTIGDFNGDGHPDIATGSFAEGSFSGVRTFLSQYTDLDSNGTIDPGEFTGFSRGIESAIPALFIFNNGSSVGGFRSSTPVTDMATGDFDGDGITDIAITATYRSLVNLEPFQVLIFMKGDAEVFGSGPAVGTGSFYADFGVKEDSSQNPPVPAAYFTPVASAPGGTKAIIEAFRLSLADNHDIVMVSALGRNDDNFAASILRQLLRWTWWQPCWPSCDPHQPRDR
jgi:hypothetical protein